MAGTGIGEDLRRERLRQALTLDDIVRRTKISPRSLEAIECEQFGRLPGVLFLRNFVRLYALELKLDPEQFIARLPRVDIESAPLPNPPRGTRSKWDPRLVATLASVLWLLAAGGAGTGAWYYFEHYRHTSATVASAPAPAMTSPATNAVASQTPQVETPSRQSAKPDSTSLGDVVADRARPVQVILTATEAAWVQVSADGRTAFEGVLHPHDTRAVAADAQVKIITGNAGGLEISLNGKALDPIGPSGQVRTVRLTAEGPQLVPKTPPVSSPL